MQRGRTAAGLLAVASICAALVVSNSVSDHGATAAAAAPPAANAPATAASASDGDRTLSVDPASDLATVNASVTVSGSGFDTDNGIYLAVCRVGFKKNQDLSACIGGSVPGQNGTNSWARVSDDAEGAVAWGDDGSFSLTLQLAAATGDSVDCLSEPCAVYARSDAEKAKDRANDLTVPVAFTTAGNTSTSVSTTSTSKTTATKPSTSTGKPSTPTTSAESTTEESTTEPETTAPVVISVVGILADQVQVGSQQTVLFSGFLPEEPVRATVFSDPKDLGEMKATKEGTLRVQFDITEDLLPGAHILQVVGLTSGSSASADFTVLAAPVAPSSEPATTASSAPASTTASSEQPTTASSVVDTTTAAPTSTSAVASSSAAPPVVPVPEKDSNSSKVIWWLLAGLLVVLIVAGVITWIAIKRRREEKLEEERLLREEELAEAALATQEAHTQLLGTAGPRTFESPRVPTDDHGLLSGREHGDGPALYSGQGPQGPISAEDARTQFIPLPDPETEQIPPAGAPVEPIEHEDNYGLFTHQGDPGTEQINPETQQINPDPGPGTAQWRPDFDDPDGDDPDDEIPPAPPGTWTPPPKR